MTSSRLHCSHGPSSAGVARGLFSWVKIWGLPLIAPLVPHSGTRVQETPQGLSYRIVYQRRGGLPIDWLDTDGDPLEGADRLRAQEDSARYLAQRRNTFTRFLRAFIAVLLVVFSFSPGASPWMLTIGLLIYLEIVIKSKERVGLYKGIARQIEQRLFAIDQASQSDP